MMILPFAVLDPATLAAILGSVLALITLIGTAIYRNFRNEGLAGQIEAKDAVIRTNAQTIEAFEGRISTLEAKLTEMVSEHERALQVIADLKLQVTNWEHKYQGLKEFIIPASIDRLIELLKDDGDDPAVRGVINDLKIILRRLEALGSRIPSS